MERPAWFENMCLAIAPLKDAEQRLADLLWLSSRINAWLDAVHVVGNIELVAMARQLSSWHQEFCDWNMLQPRTGPSEEIRQTAVRLHRLLARC